MSGTSQTRSVQRSAAPGGAAGALAARAWRSASPRAKGGVALWLVGVLACYGARGYEPSASAKVRRFVRLGLRPCTSLGRRSSFISRNGVPTLPLRPIGNALGPRTQPCILCHAAKASSFNLFILVSTASWQPESCRVRLRVPLSRLEFDGVDQSAGQRC